MKLLLTSAGISNGSIRKALDELLDKPASQCRALHVPTAIYMYPEGAMYAWQGLKQLDLGWKEYGVLELTALSSLPEESWFPAVEGADVLIVGVHMTLDGRMSGPEGDEDNIVSWGLPGMISC